MAANPGKIVIIV